MQSVCRCNAAPLDVNGLLFGRFRRAACGGLGLFLLAGIEIGSPGSAVAHHLMGSDRCFWGGKSRSISNFKYFLAEIAALMLDLGRFGGECSKGGRGTGEIRAPEETGS